MAGHAESACFFAWVRRLTIGKVAGGLLVVSLMLTGAVILPAQSSKAAAPGVLQRLSLEHLQSTVTKGGGSAVQLSQSSAQNLDFGLFYEHAVLQVVLTDPPSAAWQVIIDSLPGMWAQPSSGFFAAPGVQYCNLYLDRVGLASGTYHGLIKVEWSIPATDTLVTHFHVADTLVNGHYLPSNAAPLTGGASVYFAHEDTLSLWSANYGFLYFELRANGATEIGNDLISTIPGRGVFMWYPDQTATVPPTASTLTAVSRMTIGPATDGDDSARINYTVQGTHYPPQCLPPPDIGVRCGEPAVNLFRQAGTSPVWWRRVFGPGAVDSATGVWEWNPTCAELGTYTVAAALSDAYFPNADTCSFQVTVLDSTGFRFNLGDVDCNDVIDVLDIVGIIDHIFSGMSICYSPLADWNCSGSPDVMDLVAVIDYAFAGGPGANATEIVSAPAGVAAGDTAMFIARTCLSGRESEIAWYSANGSPASGTGPVFKTVFATPGQQTTTFECCQGKPDTVMTTCW